MSAKLGVTKKTRCAEKQIFPVPVEAQLSLATLCAWNVGRAEQQRPQRRLDFGGHFWTSAGCRYRLSWRGYVHRLREILQTSCGQGFEVCAKTLPADSGSRASQQPQPAHDVPENCYDLWVVETTLTRCFVRLDV